MTTDNTNTPARANGTVAALVGDFHLPALPYRKTDSVADLDAPQPPKARRPPRPAVPARRCSLSATCNLRKRGTCDALHCKEAGDYIANRVL